MTHFVEEIPLKSPAPGTSRFLTVHRFIGKASGPKVYLQAALHADEWPGLLTLQHILKELVDLDKQGRILGEIVVVPFANPIGMDQKINGTVLGRQSFSAEGNFNRDWPDFSVQTLKYISSCQDNGAVATIEGVRDTLRNSVNELPSQTPLQQLKATLLSLSIDADYVLDLHCDSESMMHIYSNYRHQEQSELLAKYMSSPIVLLEDEPGGSPFDAAHVLPWIAAEQAGLELSCYSTTVELRGFSDVSDEFSQQDSRGILAFLTTQNSIDRPPVSVPDFTVQSTDLSAVDSVSAPVSGIVAWKAGIGDFVEKGQVIAEIVDITAQDPYSNRTQVNSRTNGLMFARPTARLVSEGDNIAKIAGSVALENISGGGLLSL
jgi:predicted deacylase